MDLEALLHQQLHSLWSEYVLLRRKIVRKPSRKTVHEFRVNLRRFLSLLDIISTIGARKSSQKLRKKLKRELKSWRDVRDSQVQLKRAKSEALEEIDKDRYLKFLIKSESKGIKSALKKMQKWDADSNLRSFEKIEHKLNVAMAGAKAKDKETAASNIRAEFSKALQKAESLQSELQPGDHKSFHKFRLQMKDISYKAELANPILGIPTELSDHITAIRKALGNLQDQFTFVTATRKFLKSPDAELDTVLIEQEKQLAQNLAYRAN